MIFPYLPGSDSPAFKGVSVFIGLLITMGAGSAIANIFAGIVMVYMSPFKVGDYVKVADISGKIIEMGLLVTRIRTIKNELITIANSNILSKDIINYSASVESKDKLILYINIGLGYDADSDLVEKLLIESCEDYQHTLEEPTPFVNITSFEQSFINYELYM